ncbi:MAG: TolC family protein [bacterium]
MKKLIGLIFLSLFLTSAVFSETTLEDALINSKTGSLDFKQIVLDRDVQNKALLQTLPSILPYVNYTLSVDSSDMTEWSYSQSVGISQKLFDLPVFISLYKNKEYTDIANCVYLKGVYTLYQNVIEQYFSLLEYQIRLDLDTLLIKRESENVRRGESQHNAGLISETEYMTLKSNYYNVMYSYKTDQNGYDAALINFKSLTGIDSPDRLADVDTIPLFEEFKTDINDLLRNIPEYVIAKKTYSASAADEVSSVMEFTPKASLNVSYGLSDSVLDIDPSRFMTESSFRAGVSISFPVFTGFSRTLNVIDKSYARKSSHIDFLKISQNLSLELENLSERISWTKDLYESAKNGFDASEKIFAKSQRLYEAGEISTTEYITYQKGYLESAMNFINAKKEVYKLYYRYLYLIRRKP